MNWKAQDFYPVMGTPLTAANTIKLDFSPANLELEAVDLAQTPVFDRYVFDQLAKAEKSFGIGGYLENRAIYRRSGHFAVQDADFRDVHLGIDIWAQAGSPVFAPVDGMIYSLQDNPGFGNYGPTIILTHELNGKTLFSLYGHLTLTDLSLHQVGESIKAGDLIGHLGPFPENGDWPPHLHFQLMWDMEGNTGDYPGVCSKRDRDNYAANCPDPNLILNCEVLD